MLADLLALGDRELISIVGAGGKTTLMFALGRELVAAGERVVMTTTTKLGNEQADMVATTTWTSEPAQVDLALERVGPVLLLNDDDGHKLSGPSAAEVDSVFAHSRVDYVIVEADGARRRSFKAPAEHEPVIPAASTMVVAVVGIDAVGRTVADVAHRPERVAELTGCRVEDRITPAIVAAVLDNSEGSFRGTPAAARKMVAIAKVSLPAHERAAAAIQRLVKSAERIVVLPPLG